MVFVPEELDQYRLHAPATDRNREPLLQVLQDFLPASGTVLEIAAGTGEHAAYFAKGMPHLTWLPSDILKEHLSSIEAWRQHTRAKNMLSPLLLDVTEAPWPVEKYAPVKPVTAIVAINMVHIAPWDAVESLFDGAARILSWGGVLVLYGPFRVGGEHTAPSNQAFHENLITSNPQWGVRDLDSVKSLARARGFAEPDVMDMPANNLSLVFRLS